jgi:hypothetical protein
MWNLQCVRRDRSRMISPAGEQPRTNSASGDQTRRMCTSLPQPRIQTTAQPAACVSHPRLTMRVREFAPTTTTTRNSNSTAATATAVVGRRDQLATRESRTRPRSHTDHCRTTGCLSQPKVKFMLVLACKRYCSLMTDCTNIVHSNTGPLKSGKKIGKSFIQFTHSHSSSSFKAFIQLHSYHIHMLT